MVGPDLTSAGMDVAGERSELAVAALMPKKKMAPNGGQEQVGNARAREVAQTSEHRAWPRVDIKLMLALALSSDFATRDIDAARAGTAVRFQDYQGQHEFPDVRKPPH